MTRFSLFLLVLFSLTASAQDVMVDSVHRYSRLLSRFYQAKANNDRVMFRNLAHPYYTVSKTRVQSTEDSLLIAHQFSLRTFPKMRVSDTTFFNGKYYCRVAYTLNCTKKINGNDPQEIRMLTEMYNALFETSIIYFDKETSSLRYYRNKSALLVKQPGNDWRILEFEPSSIASYFLIEPREAFYAVAGLDQCILPAYTTEQLGRLAFRLFAEGRADSLSCKAAIQHDELLWAMKNEKRKPDENQIYSLLVKKKATIDHDVSDLKKAFNWRDAKFIQVFSEVERANGTSFSAILVEFQSAGALRYFEIEAVQTPAGWRIIDDLNEDSFHEHNKEFIARRK